MGWIVVGRFIQGFGGGLEVAMAYVAVRRIFPEVGLVTRDRIDVVVEPIVGHGRLPLVGGIFVHFGSWRSAFVATALTAGLLATGAFFTLPPAAMRRTPRPRVRRRTRRTALHRDCRNVLGINRHVTAHSFSASSA